MGMKDASEQNVHIHGQTLDVRTVATGAGPHPQYGSSGQGKSSRLFGGFGHSVRSIIGHSAKDFAPSARMIRGYFSGCWTRSTMIVSPEPWQILSNSGIDSISSGATVACMPPVKTSPRGFSALNSRAARTANG